MKTIHLLYAANNRLLPHFPESSLALAGVLEQHGYRLRLTDLVLEPENSWAFENPLVFGITAYTNESIRLALSATRKLKERFPGVPIIWGGPHAQMAPGQAIAHPDIDMVCFDEGERTLLEMCRQLSAGMYQPASIPGIIYKEDGRIVTTEPAALYDVNDLPFPPYHLLRKEIYPIAGQKVYYQSSRGCPFSCTYCSYKHYRKWRSKSPEKVVAELKRIREELQPREIYFSDANFFVDLARVRRICEGMLAERLDMKWTAFCRVDSVKRMDHDLLNLMKLSGCYQLDIGGESGSDVVLKALSKGITRAMILHSVEMLSRAGIRPELSFITGLPMETVEMRAETLSLIDQIVCTYPETTINGLFQYQPYPNTVLGKETIDRWKLPMPRTLEEWAEHPITIPRREYFPWLSDREYSVMLTTVSIVSYRFLYGRLIHSAETMALQGRALFKLTRCFVMAAHNLVIRHLIRLRLEKGVYALPVEWMIYRKVRDNVVKMI